MVNSGRSRRQLQKGVILKKWNGDPLIIAAKERAAEIAKSKQEQGGTTATVASSSFEQQGADNEQQGNAAGEEQRIIADVAMSDHENKSGCPGTASTDATVDSETMLGGKKSDDDNSKVDDEMSMDPNDIFGEM